MVLVNPFSGKVSHAFHFHSECVTTYPTNSQQSFQISQGGSVKLFNRIVKPILNYTKCSLGVTCQLVQKIRMKLF